MVLWSSVRSHDNYFAVDAAAVPSVYPLNFINLGLLIEHEHTPA